MNPRTIALSTGNPSARRGILCSISRPQGPRLRRTTFAAVLGGPPQVAHAAIVALSREHPRVCMGGRLHTAACVKLCRPVRCGEVRGRRTPEPVHEQRWDIRVRLRCCTVSHVVSGCAHLSVCLRRCTCSVCLTVLCLYVYPTHITSFDSPFFEPLRRYTSIPDCEEYLTVRFFKGGPIRTPLPTVCTHTHTTEVYLRWLLDASFPLESNFHAYRAPKATRGRVRAPGRPSVAVVSILPNRVQRQAQGAPTTKRS